VTNFLDGSSSLQRILDVFRIYAVEPLELLVELQVPLVDVVNIGVRVVAPPPAVLLPLLLLLIHVIPHFLDELWVILVYSVDYSASRRVEGIFSLLLLSLVEFHVRLDLLGEAGVLAEGGLLEGAEPAVGVLLPPLPLPLCQSLPPRPLRCV
jgi:hypothetical protein